MPVLTVVSLLPAAGRSTYVNTGDRIIEVSHAVLCSKREADSCALVAVDGNIVGFLTKWDNRSWSYQARRDMCSGSSDYARADRSASDLGVENFLSSLLTTGKTRGETLAKAGFVVI